MRCIAAPGDGGVIVQHQAAPIQVGCQGRLAFVKSVEKPKSPVVVAIEKGFTRNQGIFEKRTQGNRHTLLIIITNSFLTSLSGFFPLEQGPALQEQADLRDPSP